MLKVVFGDSTHAAAMTKILAREMGIHVVWAGTYCKEVTKPNSTGCCVGFRYRLTQPTIGYNTIVSWEYSRFLNLRWRIKPET